MTPVKPESEITIALLGAGGKMGLRTANNLLKTSYKVRHAEIADRGRALLAEKGITAVTPEEAVDGADVTILALPDNRIGQISEVLGSRFRSGSMLIALDIAAPLAGHLPKRDDLTFSSPTPATPLSSGAKRNPTPRTISSEASPPAKTSFARSCRGRKKITLWVKRLPAPCTPRFWTPTAALLSKWPSSNPSSRKPFLEPASR